MKNQTVIVNNSTNINKMNNHLSLLKFLSNHLYSFLCFVCLHPVSCVLNVPSVSGLSSSCVLCAQCSQCLWIVFILCLVCSMFPVSLDCLHPVFSMFPVSLDCPFLIASLVFCSDYLDNNLLTAKPCYLKQGFSGIYLL